MYGSGDDVSSTMAFGMEQGAFGQQQLHHQQQHDEHPPPPVGERYKSCDFCAKRKRKCSGGLPRCSLCIQKKQPYCHYKLKPLTKASAAMEKSARRRSSSSSSSSSSNSSVGSGAASQLAGAVDVAIHTGGDATMATGTRNMTMVPGSTSLKRFRLSASLATGLVGTQENCFLGDFFGCLGILPLATESTVRSAIIEVMMGAVPPPQRYKHEREHHGNGGLAMGGEAYQGAAVGNRLTGGEEERWSGASVGRGVPDNPAKCIMWCAIALGALMRGSPVEFVAGYIRLARESLSECFDCSNLETARAYLMMSFFHSILHDMESSEKYFSFAMSIVNKLGPDEVPEELETFLPMMEKMKLFRGNGGKQATTDDVNAFCRTVADLPTVRGVMQPKDVCKVVLVADRRLNQAFIKDMRSQGAFDHAEDAVEREGEGEPVLGEVLEQPGCGGTAGKWEGGAWRSKGSQQPAGGETNLINSWHNGPEPPPAGIATKEFVQQALPELLRLSKTLETSDTCSGVGGLVYHGGVAYMKAVTGDLADGFKSLEACVRVISRYPGSARFRPHLMHCILAVSHFSNRQDVYDAMRGIYNSVRPLPGCTLAPTFEEFTGMHQLCNHVFCRSAQVEIFGFEARHNVEPTSAVDSRQAAGSSAARSSLSASSDTSWAGREIHKNNGSPLVGLGQAPQWSSATDTVAPAPPPIPLAAANAQQVLHQAGTAACESGAAEREMHRALMSEPVTSAAAAETDAHDSVWQSAEAGQQLSATSTAPSTGDPASDLTMFSGESWSEHGAMNLIDGDLLDVAAVLLGEEGVEDNEFL